MKKFTFALALLILAGSYPPKASSDSSVDKSIHPDQWIGAIDQEGILTPLLKYAGGKWSSPWTSNQKSATSPPITSQPPTPIPTEWLGGSKTIPNEWKLVQTGNPENRFSLKGLQKPSTFETCWGYGISLSSAVVAHRDRAWGYGDLFASTLGLDLQNFSKLSEADPVGKRIIAELALVPTATIAKAGPFLDRTIFYRFVSEVKHPGGGSITTSGIVAIDKTGVLRKLSVHSVEVDAEKDYEYAGYPAVLVTEAKHFALQMTGGEGIVNIVLLDLDNGSRGVESAPY